jgi:hypothetical protein
VPEHSSLVAAAGHSSLGALARRSLGVEVGHSSLGALVAAVVGHLAPVAVHLAHRLLGAGVGHLALASAVGQHLEVELRLVVAPHPASAYPEAHWDWVAADTRYYSQLD